ncbi:hypothetical protein QL093DRAFT_1411382 [Fusarium oxysporum]|nr:hypothetical protein QL093DRAFT_1411382 [Fusarium oxysporum]
MCRTWTASRALFLTQTSRFWTNVNNDDDIITITTTTFMSALRINIQQRTYQHTGPFTRRFIAGTGPSLSRTWEHHLSLLCSGSREPIGDTLHRCPTTCTL